MKKTAFIGIRTTPKLKERVQAVVKKRKSSLTREVEEAVESHVVRLDVAGDEITNQK